MVGRGFGQNEAGLDLVATGKIKERIVVLGGIFRIVPFKFERLLFRNAFASFHLALLPTAFLGTGPEVRPFHFRQLSGAEM